MKRWLIYSLLTVLILILLIVGIAIWLIYTEAGLQFAAKQAQQWAPGQLKMATLEGRLSDEVRLTGLSYQHQDTSIKVESFELAWELGALWAGKVHIKKLYINNVQAYLPKKEKPEPESGPFELPDIRLPVQLALDDVQINQVLIKQGEDEPLIIDNIQLRSKTTDVLSLEQLQVKSPLFNADLKGHMGLTKPHPVQLDLDWSAPLPEDMMVTGQGEISGDMGQLVLTHTVSKPLEVQLETTIKDVLGALEMNGQLTWQEIYWPLNPKTPKDYLVHSQQGQVNLTGALDDYHFDFKAKISGQQIPSGDWTLIAQGNREQVTIKTLSAALLEGLLKASGQFHWQPALAGQLKLDVDQFNLKAVWPDWPEQFHLKSQLVAELADELLTVEQFKITIPETAAQLSFQGQAQVAQKPHLKQASLKWQGLQWPLAGDDIVFSSPKGQANVSGTADDYQLDLNTQLVSATLPPSRLQLKGQGNQQQFRIDSLQSDLLEGTLKATGKVRWQPNLTAQLNLNANQLTIKNFWPDWPAQLRLNSQLIAQLNDKNFQISRFKLNIPQTAAQLSLEGQGTLAGQDTRFKQATLMWQGLQWPLVGKKSLMSSQKGQINLTGTLQNYQVQLKTQLAGQNLPASQWQVAGQGNLQQFTIDSIQSQLLKGTLKGNGKVRWQPALAAQVNLNTHDITIKDFWKDWPKSLRLDSLLMASLDKDHFKIESLIVKVPKISAQFSLQGQGTLAGENTRFEKTALTWRGLRWPLLKQKKAAYLVTSDTGTLRFAGTPQDYQVHLKTQLAGDKIPTGQWQLIGQGDLQQFTINSLRSEVLQGDVTGQGRVSWKPQLAGRATLDVNAINIQEFWSDWPKKLRLNSRLKAQLAGDQFNIQQLKIDIPQTQAQLSLQGRGTLAGEKTRFNTALAWQGLQWPLTGSGILVQSEKGHLQAEGTLQDYQLQLDTDLTGQDIPKGRWQAVGEGDQRHFQLDSLKGQVLQGALNLAGQISWQPNVAWQLILDGDRLNPGVQWAEWPGQLAFDIQSQGQLNKGQLETQIKIKQLQGQLRDYPLKLQTALKVQGKNYEIKAFNLKSGNAQLTANGQVGPNSDLDWTINAPDLANLLPNGQGNINGQGHLSGSLDWPHVTAELKGKGLAFQDKQLAHLAAEMDVDLRSDKDLRLNVVATDFKQGTTQIERFSLQGQGRIGAHTIVTSVIMPENRLSLQLAGGFQQPHWQGQLEQLTVSTEQLGYWQLKTPADLTLSATEAQLTQSCIQNTRSAQFCTQGHWQKAAKSTFYARLENLPMGILRAFLPIESELSGNINGTMGMNLNSEGQLQSDMTIKLSPGLFKTHFTEEVEQFAHQGGTLECHVNQKGLVADLQLSLLDQSHVKGKLNLPRFTHLPPQGKQPISGKLDALFADLSILPTLVPQAENSQGRVNMNLAVDGSLTEPKIEAQVQVVDAATDLPDIGLSLKNVNMTVHTEGHNTLKMQAGLDSGKGHLDLNGEAQLLSMNDWNAYLKLTGQNFEMVNIPTAWAIASPDIEVKMIPNRLDVTGKVFIPEAMITPAQTGTGAVTVSEDVVIVNPSEPIEEPKDKTSQKGKAGQMVIYSQVKIILGDNVSFKGAGFKSRLAGTLVASQQPGKVPIGNGELKIIDGTYKAYGQDLRIDNGLVIYSGGPIENPGLDITAYRRIRHRGQEEIIAGVTISPGEEITTGVHVQGTAQSPQLTLFSEPRMDQSNTLSFIVLGKPMIQSVGGEGNLLMKAATSLPISQGDQLVKQIGQELGLDEVAISSEGGIEEAALVVGKYLTPDLYISYGIGLFDGHKVLQMRYALTKKLSIETETGTESGFDLRYTFEH